LQLKNAYYPFYDDGSGRQLREPRIALSRSVFPTLHSLTIDHCGTLIDEFGHIAPLPPLSEVPTLSNLTVLDADFGTPSMISFIERYGHSVEHMKIHSAQGFILVGIFEVLLGLKPNHLTLEHGSDRIWGKIFQGRDLGGYFCGYENILKDLPKGFEKDLANTVVLGPAKSVQTLEKYWAAVEEEQASGNKSE
jgi:hypothetical protein